MQKVVSDLAHRVEEGMGLREENKEGGVKKMIAVLLDDLILINPTNK